MEKHFFKGKCECGCEVLEIEHLPKEKEFCFAQFKHTPFKHSLKTRIKFLFSGFIYYNEIILNYRNAKDIADYINTNIENNGKEED